MLEIRLLGGFEIRNDGAPIALSSRLAQSLFSYLILNAGTPHRREKLAGLFWPNSPEKRARASLRHELWRIGKALDQAGAQNPVLSDDMTITFDADAECRIDIWQLTRLGSDACIGELMEGLALYRGELLPGFYEDWLVVEREHLFRVLEQGVSRLLHLLRAEQRWQEVLEWAERWLALGQQPEEAYRCLMVAYTALGDRAKVLSTYDRCQHGLSELGLEASEETRALAEVNDAPGNLPTPMTSFIGREKEVEEISTMLFASRLITLTGAGGVGKTRLAIEAARGLTGRFPDGVWYVELAPLDDPDMLPEALRTVLGIPEAGKGTRPAAELLANYFRSRTTMVLLDNCEHLLEACARLVQALLPACPGLRILATSREPLRAEGETTYLVPSLELPEGPDSEALPSLEKVASVRLFVERACSRSSSFMLARQNATSIAEICVRLDGIPLAIELAAARVGSLSVEDIRGRLDQRFALLAVGLRTEIPRHQTLRALIDWSHDLLSTPERVLFRRLSVFAGGWTLESAEAVGAIGELHDTDVLQLLPELAEKSLVVLDAGSGRYHMLETVREYALECLREASEEADIRGRHLDCCIKLAESLVPGLAPPEEAMSALIVEHDNFVGALRWCDHAESGAQKGMQLIGALGLYWAMRGQYSLAYRLAGHLMSLPGAEAKTLARRRALGAVAHYGFFCGDLTAARDAAEESLSLAREIGDPRGIVESLFELGNAVGELGDDEAGIQHHQCALELATALEYRLMVQHLRTSVAEALRCEGRFEEARGFYEQALAYARQSKYRHLLVTDLSNMAMVSIQLAKVAASRDYLCEALTLVAESPYRLSSGEQLVLQTCAGYLAASEDWSRGARLYGASEALRDELGTTQQRADALFIAPLMAHAREALGEEAYQSALNEGGKLSPKCALAEARTALALGN